MAKLKWGIVLFFLTIGLYCMTYFILCKVEYNERPLVYLFSDYLGPNGGFTFNKSQEWDGFVSQGKQWDVVVLGASRAERSYDPAFFKNNGVELFNWGSSAQSMENSNLLLKGILEQCQPKEIWLDIVPASFKGEALESTADLVQNVKYNHWAFNIAWASKDIRAVNLLTKRLFCSNEFQTKKGKSTYYSQGYVAVSDSMEKGILKQCQEAKPATKAYFAPAKQSINALEAFIKTCVDRKIQLRILISPTTQLYNDMDHQVMMQSLNALKSKWVFQIYDFSDDKRFEVPQDFYDEKHLNRSGALKYNRFLLDSLSEK